LHGLVRSHAPMIRDAEGRSAHCLHVQARYIRRGPTLAPLNVRKVVPYSLSGEDLMTLDILIVDDDPDLRMALAYVLNDRGHVVSEAADGAEALRRFSERVFDLILCDIRLPKIDGLSLLRRVHDVSPTTVVVMMTAFPRVPDAIAALHD